MISKTIKLALALLLISISVSFGAISSEYVILISKSVEADSEWMKAVNTLQKRHSAAILTYINHPEDVENALKAQYPRYVAVFDKPENLNADFVIRLNRLSRRMDNDMYVDFLYGIMTGYDASTVMRMVQNSKDPFVIKSALNTTSVASDGTLFDRFAYISDGKKGVWGEKKSVKDPVKEYEVSPWDILSIFVEKYKKLKPDLLITSGHGSEEALEMSFSVGELRTKNGDLYADFYTPETLPAHTAPRVYFPAGNCLIGNVNNDPQSMAVAWMSGGGATAMIGYVVPTWYGRGGWGELNTWMRQGDELTLAQAVFMSQQQTLFTLQQWDAKLASLMPEIPLKSFNLPEDLMFDLEKTLGRKISNDELGFMHDRDVLAVYGDPKWDARFQKKRSKSLGYDVTWKQKGEKVELTINTHQALDSTLRIKDKEGKIGKNTMPFHFFFPKRLKSPKLAAGQSWQVALDENFLTIYNPGFVPNKKYTIILDVEK